MLRSGNRAAAALLSVLVAAIALGGCGQGTQIDEEAVAAAAQNAEVLQLSQDVASTQLLEGATGQITSLGDVVTGDRAVLVWYWAPN